MKCLINILSNHPFADILKKNKTANANINGIRKIENYIDMYVIPC